MERLSPCTHHERLPIPCPICREPIRAIPGSTVKFPPQPGIPAFWDCRHRHALTTPPAKFHNKRLDNLEHEIRAALRHLGGEDRNG